nr:MAG TPA: hypothetical protein [Caudoviricetes sp.]
MALGYSNGRDAVAKHVDEGDVAKRDMGGGSKMRHSSNKYRLIN